MIFRIIDNFTKTNFMDYMSNITKEQYEFALERIEELLPLVGDDTPASDNKAIELTMMSDIVIAYEKEHFIPF